MNCKRTRESEISDQNFAISKPSFKSTDLEMLDLRIPTQEKLCPCRFQTNTFQRLKIHGALEVVGPQSISCAVGGCTF